MFERFYKIGVLCFLAVIAILLGVQLSVWVSIRRDLDAHAQEVRRELTEARRDVADSKRDLQGAATDLKLISEHLDRLSKCGVEGERAPFNDLLRRLFGGTTGTGKGMAAKPAAPKAEDGNEGPLTQKRTP